MWDLSANDHFGRAKYNCTELLGLLIKSAFHCDSDLHCTVSRSLELVISAPFF